MINEGPTMASEPLAVGPLVRQLREARGLSETELARRAGLEPKRLRALEAGTTAQPHVPTLHALAGALSVPVSTFLPPPHTLGERVAWWRTMRGFSVPALAAAVGMDPSAILHIEKDRRPPFNRTLQRLAAAFGVAVIDLLGDTHTGVLADVQAGARPRDRQALQTLARAVGRPLAALYVMDQNADPFIIGTPTHVQAGEWFKALWDRFDFPQGVHLRRIHYRILSYPDVVLPTGQPYANTWACYEYLNDAGRYARILGLVAPDTFEDRRNPPPHVHALARATPAPWCTTEPPLPWRLPHIQSDLATQLRFSLPDVQIGGYSYDAADQPYLLEVWIEKSTMDDVLVPLCQRLGANLVTSVGMQSITNAVKMLQRTVRIGKPARIFYISDFDPAGDCMPVGVARQAEFWLARYAPHADIKLTPLALTHDQVVQYQLPRIPVKESDTRRGRFEERYGAGAVELDALEALHPGALAAIVTTALRPYLDRTLPQRLAAAADEAQTAVSKAWNSAIETQTFALDELADEARAVLQRYEERLATLDAELQTELVPLAERLAKVEDEIDSIAEAFDPDLPKRPEPEVEEPDESAWLFDSDRDYLTQLEYYRAHRDGGAVPDDDDDVA
jgi:transcriptional regulator with XRE-family HTH domain